jgi:hypothetical protein
MIATKVPNKKAKKRRKNILNFYNKLDLCKLDVNESSKRIFSFGKLKDKKS